MPKAFTLLELLVVITIIGILSSIVMVSMSGSTDSASIVKGKAYAQQVHALLGHEAVGVWNFDEGTENTCSATEDVCDISGHNNHGIFYGDTQFVDSDIEGYALSFDGTDDYVSAGGDFSGVEAFTVEAWVKTPGSSDFFDTLVSFRGGNLPIVAPVYTSGASIIALGSSNYKYFSHSPVNIDDNSWHHVVFVVVGNDQGDIANAKMYADGIEQNSSSISQGGLPNSKTSVTIGKYSSLYYLGLIDEVRIYSSALSATEIQKHYVQGLKKLLVSQAITQAEYDQRMEGLN
jgi:prepilin-type N-terminal cleavage/methylation domain-containing protein